MFDPNQTSHQAAIDMLPERAVCRLNVSRRRISGSGIFQMQKNVIAGNKNDFISGISRVGSVS